jgi:glutamate N-acetyltransferase/amino-acid N-acetyltransferase
MVLIYSEKDAVTAGVFTESKVKAAPVLLCIEKIKNASSGRAVIVNSGNANACTGERGMNDAVRMAELTAELLGIESTGVFVASTGRIGEFMPMDIIQSGIRKAADALNSGVDCADPAEAIMTTDTRPKRAAVSFKIDGKKVTLGAIAKGAGMIDPKMTSPVPHATMLSFIPTDADISKEALNAALSYCAQYSFNKITVDGDMSTNDTVLIMANGAAGNEMIESGSAGFELFRENLLSVMKKLAADIVLDAEGATKFVTVKVKNAATSEDAEKSAEAIANSLLCKTAWFGCDPNWGRVIAAAGYSGADFDPEKVSLFYDNKPVVKNGRDAGTSEKELSELMKKGDFSVELDLNAGKYCYEIWTSDISYEYVKITADYHT